MESFYSNGKLLITGEYAVLDGARALALPTKFGQSLNIITDNSSQLVWKSYNEKNNLWFEGIYNLENLIEISSSDTKVSETLLRILKEAQKLNLKFLVDSTGYEIQTKLDFPRNWGLGTSSTLINNIAQWANVDAFKLLEKSFGGSGYDIACAQNDSPILYQLKNGPPDVKKTSFIKSFRKNLYFVHLNDKQNSANEIARYSKQKIDRASLIRTITEITNRVANCENLQEFEALLNNHESIISEVLKIPTIKETLFQDFDGSVKSLGAWGGDFALAIGNQNTPDYYKKKGFTTVIPFDDMIL